jgi:hypothetical protein
MQQCIYMQYNVYGSILYFLRTLNNDEGFISMERGLKGAW